MQFIALAVDKRCEQTQDALHINVLFSACKTMEDENWLAVCEISTID